MSSLFSLASATVGGGHRNRAGYRIDRSVRLRSSASAYFNRTPASAGNRKTWTWSGWVKRGALAGQDLFNAYQDTNNQTLIAFSSDTLIVYTIHGGGSFDYGFQTTAVFRDPSAWYHVVVVFDSTNATAANRAAVYVNGVSQAGSMAFGDIPLNQDGIVNSTNAHSIGRRGGGSQYFDGYLTEINFIDGQALTPSSFGEINSFTGVWSAKKYTGSYGTNGFYLNFSDNSAATAAAIGKDYSGNGNNWTPNNISVTAGATYDSMLDVPTQWDDKGNGRGNYATLNPLDNSGVTVPTLQAANLEAVFPNADRTVRGTFGVSSGKWYFEFTATNVGGIYNTIQNIGIAAAGVTTSSASAWNLSIYDGNKLNNNGSTGYASGTGSGAVGIVGIAFDLDNGKIWWSRNGTYANSGDPAAGTNAAFTNVSGTVFPFLNGGGGGYSGTATLNFGQRPFTYTPPTGFKALNTLNLP